MYIHAEAIKNTETSNLYAEVKRVFEEGRLQRTEKLNEYISFVRKDIINAAREGLDYVKLEHTFREYDFNTFAAAFEDMYPEFSISSYDNGKTYYINWEYK